MSAIRSVLIAHMDGPALIIRHGASPVRAKAYAHAVMRGWLREGNPLCRAPKRPELSYITQAGRAELARLLAAWADSLIQREDALAARLSELEAAE